MARAAGTDEGDDEAATPAPATAPAAPRLAPAETEAPDEAPRPARTRAARKNDKDSGNGKDNNGNGKTKAIPFDRTWLEPFFKRGPAKQAVENFRAEDWEEAAAGFAKALRGLPRSGEEHRAASYLLALARANKGDWAGAGTLFEDLYARYPKLAPYHAYHAARCRLRRGDAPGAIEWAGKVAKATVPEAETELIRIDALRALARWEDVLAGTETYLQRFPNGPRRAEALFKKAEATEKAAATAAAGATTAPAAGAPAESSRPAPPAAVALYRRVWAEAPLEAWSERAAERLEQIAAALPAAEATVIRTRTANELVSRGDVYFDCNRNGESESTFAAALAAPGLDADLECRARFFRAQSVWKQRQRARAAPLFDEADAACARAGNKDLHTKALYQGARCYANAGNREAALTRYTRVEAEHAGPQLRRRRPAARGGARHRRGRRGGRPRRCCPRCPTRYPKGDLLSEALWRLAFAAWRASGLGGGARAGWTRTCASSRARRSGTPRGGPSTGRGGCSTSRASASRPPSLYKRAVREYPLSVYALLGAGAPAAQIRRRTRSASCGRVAAQGRARRATPGRSPRAAATGGRVPAGGGAGAPGARRRRPPRAGPPRVSRRGRDAARSGAARRRRGPPLDHVDPARSRAASGARRTRIPRYALTELPARVPDGDGEAKWRLSYPRAFPELVAPEQQGQPGARGAAAGDHARGERVHPAHRVVRQRARPDPDAGQDRQAVRQRRDGHPRHAAGPGKNVELGSRFLAFLLERFNARRAADHRQLQRRRGGGRPLAGRARELAMDEFMETIPYDETRNYTKRVLSSYFTYAWLYGDSPVPELPLAARGDGKAGRPQGRNDGGDAPRRGRPTTARK